MVVEACSLFLMYKSSNNKNAEPVVLENVVYNDSSIKFVYMLEQNRGMEDYLKSYVNNWPSDIYQYDEFKSNCLNYDNEKIADALSYNLENNLVILNSNIAKICYLYFNKKENTNQLD